MLVQDTVRTSQTLGSLLHDLVDESRRLLRQEWRLAKLELTKLGSRLGKGAMEVAAGGVCLALGGTAALMGVALALADPWIRTHLLLAMAIGAIILALFAAWLAKGGIEALVAVFSADEKPTEDEAWDSQRRTSVATSS